MTPVSYTHLDHALAAAFCRQPYGVENFGIACAAAIIVAQGVADLIVRWIQILIEQRLCAKHHARNAAVSYTHLEYHDVAVRLDVRDSALRL